MVVVVVVVALVLVVVVVVVVVVDDFLLFFGGLEKKFIHIPGWHGQIIMCIFCRTNGGLNCLNLKILKGFNFM